MGVRIEIGVAHWVAIANVSCFLKSKLCFQSKCRYLLPFLLSNQPHLQIASAGTPNTHAPISIKRTRSKVECDAAAYCTSYQCQWDKKPNTVSFRFFHFYFFFHEFWLDYLVFDACLRALQTVHAYANQRHFGHKTDIIFFEVNRRQVLHTLDGVWCPVSMDCDWRPRILCAYVWRSQTTHMLESARPRENGRLMPPNIHIGY